jgi:hypothetical protein
VGWLRRRTGRHAATALPADRNWLPRRTQAPAAVPAPRQPPVDQDRPTLPGMHVRLGFSDGSQVDIGDDDPRARALRHVADLLVQDPAAPADR